MHTLDNPDIVNALKARALAPAAWELVRTNFERVGGGPANGCHGISTAATGSG